MSTEKLDIEPDFAYERGDGVFNGTDFESSGIRGGAVATTNAPWDLKFARKSGDTPFKYICMIHPWMRGTVKVE